MRGYGFGIAAMAAVFFPLNALAAFQISANARLSPSVNCADTSLGSHAIICASTTLSANEREIAAAYEAATSSVARDARVRIQDEHRAFVTRRDACDNSSCIADEYAARLAVLTPTSAVTPPTVVAPPAADTTGETAGTGRQLPITRTEDEPPAEDTQNSVSAEAEAAPPSTPQASPPEPVGDATQWVVQEDYPANLLRNGEAGTTRYQVQVGADGIAIRCFTVASTGHWQLDTRACHRVMDRARFTPALDTEGNAIPSIYSGEHTWTAPVQD